MTFSHLRLLTTGSDVLVPFYRDVMGVALSWGDAGEDYVHFGGEGTGEFALFTPNFQIHANAADPFVLVFASDDLESDVARLQAAGQAFTPIEDRPDWGIRVTYTRDPLGRLVEINEPIEKRA